MIGPRQRSAAEIAALPDDWRKLYDGHRCGLLGESSLLGAAARAAEIEFVSDALACASQESRSVVVRLTGSYLGLVLKSLFAATATTRHAGSPNPAPLPADTTSNYHHPVR